MMIFNVNYNHLNSLQFFLIFVVSFYLKYVEVFLAGKIQFIPIIFHSIYIHIILILLILKYSYSINSIIYYYYSNIYSIKSYSIHRIIL
jgi:hypothetical protein